MFFVGENLWGNGAQKLFGHVWVNSGKNLSHHKICLLLHLCVEFKEERARL